MQKKLFLFALALFFVNGARASNFEIVRSPDSQAFTLVGAARIANVAVAENDYDAVKLAAQLFTEDVERVTGMRPAVVAQPKAPAVIVGTLGRSALIDTLARAGKLEDLDSIAWNNRDRIGAKVQRCENEKKNRNVAHDSVNGSIREYQPTLAYRR